MGDPLAQCGAVTFIQRFGDALNLNVHFHALVLDGIYEDHPVPPPDPAKIERILRGVARRLARLQERRGLGPDDDPAACHRGLTQVTSVQARFPTSMGKCGSTRRYRPGAPPLHLEFLAIR